MKQQTHRHKQSFTLIELLIVIAIIAILAAVIVANVTSAQAQARDVRRTQDLDQLKTALEMYNFNNNKYPQGSIGGSNSDQGFCIEQNQSFKDLLITGDYISSLPQDPLYNTSQCSSPSNTNCHCYIYRTETADKYKLFAKTEQQDFKPAKQDGGISDIYYEAYAPVQGSNEIVLGWPWYEAGPYLNGIVGAWTFNEGFGPTAYDTSGNNNNGTLIPLTNGPIWVVDGTRKVLSFDGVNDWVNIPNRPKSFINPSAGFSWEAWVKRNTSGRIDMIMSYMDTSGCQDMRFYFDSSNSLVFYIDGTGCNEQQRLSISHSEPRTDTWIYVVGVVEYLTSSTGQSKLYIDGELVAESGVKSITPLDRQMYASIGGATADGSTIYNNFLFKGLIDEVRIYNRALSANEIADLYAAGAGGN